VTRRVLVVGGLDPSGGAGLTADARALQVHGCLALPVAVVLTAQNREGVRLVEPVSERSWRAALDAALGDGELHAVKTGMLGPAAQIEALAEVLRPIARTVPLVVDPVLSATAGGWQAGGDVARALRRSLAPIATVLTPNAPELAALLLGDPVRALLEDGCAAVLCKGGHGDGAEITDLLLQPRTERAFVHARQPVGPVHGTGCALASSLAAGLARGEPVDSACATAIGWLQQCLRSMGPSAAGLPRPLAIVSRTSP
jgi:hydroxymethylpyrimidine/phosphomethylpyrimidine kinase